MGISNIAVKSEEKGKAKKEIDRKKKMDAQGVGSGRQSR